MEHVFKDLKTDQKWAWASLVLCGLLLSGLILSPRLTDLWQGVVAIAAYLALCVFFWPSLLKAAHQDHRHLLTVCVWSFVLVILLITVSFYSFFKVAGSDSTKYDKLLNVVPVFVAIWAAAVGWLIHFRITTKAHRTNNAFAIIMETRKSSEYLKRQELVQKHFPPNVNAVDSEYHQYSAADSLKKLIRAGASEADMEKAEAVLALKYMLNYFEFMAVGIKAGDLDENLLFETVSSTVLRLHLRAQSYITFTVDPQQGGQPMAYCDLRLLAQRWKVRYATEEAKHS